LAASNDEMNSDNREIENTASYSCPFGRLLAGQKALVTGASSGIGRAVILAFARAGAEVAINFLHTDEAVDSALSAVEKTGAKAIAIRADISREDQVQAMFEKAIAEMGTIDILVNNAGIQDDAPIEKMTLEQWNAVINTNLTGQFLCAREAIREFKRRGIVSTVSAAAGKIIFMSSVHEVIPWAGRVNYAASKGGVMLLMKSLAQEVAPFKIRVNSICPGAIRTPLNLSAWETPAAYDALMKLIPYKRIGEPEEVGWLATFLASDYADYITGSSLFVDGGMMLYPGFESGG
jgi:glucose 1-dehydrogenase